MITTLKTPKNWFSLANMTKMPKMTKMGKTMKKGTALLAVTDITRDGPDFHWNWVVPVRKCSDTAFTRAAAGIQF